MNKLFFLLALAVFGNYNEDKLEHDLLRKCDSVHFCYKGQAFHQYLVQGD
jgi:hypothetical protein